MTLTEIRNDLAGDIFKATLSDRSQAMKANLLVKSVDYFKALYKNMSHTEPNLYMFYEIYKQVRYCVNLAGVTDKEFDCYVGGRIKDFMEKEDYEEDEKRTD